MNSLTANPYGLSALARKTEGDMLYQTLDDKKECIGVFTDGRLEFDAIPSNLTKTWKASSSIRRPNTEYAWLYANGVELDEVCPDDLKDNLNELSRKFKAYLKAFNIANVPMDEVCFFDLVPHRFLLDWCGTKNDISQYVFDTFEKPKNHDHLASVHELLVDISNQAKHQHRRVQGLFISHRVRPLVLNILTHHHTSITTSLGRLQVALQHQTRAKASCLWRRSSSS